MNTNKRFILTVMLAAALGAQAQYSEYYYHRTGDTVYKKSEIGFYNWWDFDYMISLGEKIVAYPEVVFPHKKVVITPYTTTVPLKIVGIAGCPDFGNNYGNPFLPEYFYLFDATSNGPVYKDRSQLILNDSTPHRYLYLEQNGFPVEYGFIWDSCCKLAPNTTVLKLFECYFDTAITVSDSFYVGWSNNNSQVHYNQASHGSDVYHSREPCSELDNFTHSILTNCYFPVFDYFYCTDSSINSYPGNNYTWIKLDTFISRQFTLVYPLIQIDTTVPPSFLCDPVQNFSATVLDSGSGCVFFTWDDFYHYTFCEVQYYTFEQGYNSAVTTTVTGNNLLHLCDLDTTLTYFARIRAYCDTSKIETEWSNWVSFSFPHSAPPQGVAEPSLLDRFTHVMPNPAADRVTVSSELGLRRIEVYNARGILVYSEPSHYSSKTIDLRGWPSGQYMMTIETRQGKTAKRLVVTR